MILGRILIIYLKVVITRDEKLSGFLDCIIEYWIVWTYFAQPPLFLVKNTWIIDVILYTILT